MASGKEGPVATSVAALSASASNSTLIVFVVSVAVEMVVSDNINDVGVGVVASGAVVVENKNPWLFDRSDFGWIEWTTKTFWASSDQHF
ncbi:hypothetical protein INT45_003932 [Circinella minor]|uniref:Uncharacterized protein n=1 Tax=Circinella minor TaxID=1195481 RepID=A0A8H7RXL6_9FUNG|nr:hypothetical protein INT45_003932 [Circinella minor]